MTTETISLSFGEMESMLAKIHRIDQAKRTAFQSRLKNFHRLGYPQAFDSIKGKASTYSPLQIVDMALAVEMTQLGLPPERSTQLLSDNRWSILMGIALVARELHANPDAWSSQHGLSDSVLSMFLYFDPVALDQLAVSLPPGAASDHAPASDPLFNVGVGIVSEDLAKWTSGASARLSMINLSVVAARLAVGPYPQSGGDDLAYRRSFYRMLELDAAHARSDPSQ